MSIVLDHTITRQHLGRGKIKFRNLEVNKVQVQDLKNLRKIFFVLICFKSFIFS